MSAKVRLNCKNCGHIYYRYKIRIRAGFCSRQCWSRYQRKTGRIHRACATCGSLVERFKNRLKTRKVFFCSRQCHALWISINLSGSRSRNWQGGKTSEAYRIRHSLAYEELRRLVFLRDDYTCQLCLVRGGQLQLDHIKAFARYPDLRLDPTNCRTVCVPCHRTTDTYGYRSRTAS